MVSPLSVVFLNRQVFFEIAKGVSWRRKRILGVHFDPGPPARTAEPGRAGSPVPAAPAQAVQAWCLGGWVIASIFPTTLYRETTKKRNRLKSGRTFRSSRFWVGQGQAGLLHPDRIVGVLFIPQAGDLLAGLANVGAVLFVDFWPRSTRTLSASNKLTVRCTVRGRARTSIDPLPFRTTLLAWT
jgi:hypothetical protein